MAKAGSTFFIRSRLSMVAAGTENEVEIPLGAFLNPLADQALTIHNIEVQICDTNEPEKGPFKSDSVFNFGWNLCTSSQLGNFDTLYLDDNSVVASGRYSVFLDADDAYFESTTRDMMPQSWTADYTVASESLFLIGHADDTSTGGTYEVSIVMECSSTKLGKLEAINLALSQTQ